MGITAQFNSLQIACTLARSQYVTHAQEEKLHWNISLIAHELSGVYHHALYTCTMGAGTRHCLSDQYSLREHTDSPVNNVLGLRI